MESEICYIDTYGRAYFKVEDGIVVPNRWHCSKGCEIERRVADICGIPVVGVIGEAGDLQILNAI